MAYYEVGFICLCIGFVIGASVMEWVHTAPITTNKENPDEL